MDDNNLTSMQNGKPSSDGAETLELQKKVLEMTRRQTLMIRVTMFVTAGIFAVILISSLILVPKGIALINKAEPAVASLTETAEELQEADLTGLIENSNEAAQVAVQKMEEIDIEKLNESISALQKIISPLANLFGN